MRVVSLVPSWTETLILAGVNVIARTRYCIHPKDVASKIPVVGGTKQVDWEKVLQLKPDLVLMDKEENPESFSELCCAPFYASHVYSLQSCAIELANISRMLKNDFLFDLASDFQKLRPRATWSFERIPGLLEFLPSSKERYEKLEYVIWKNPWMGIGNDTYIWSVLEFLGATPLMSGGRGKYPTIEVPSPGTFYLFSSEPYPFFQKKEDLLKKEFSGAIVDGESYSWFGVRGLQFLKNNL